MSKKELLKIIQEQNSTLKKSMEALKQSQASIKKNEATIKENETIILTQKQWIEQMQRMLFGSKSERFVKAPVDPKQLHLSFAELAEKSNDQSNPDQTVAELTKEKAVKTSNHKGRNKLPKTLEEKVIIIEPEQDVEGLKKIGEERTEILEYLPATFFKLVIVRPKYEKPNQEGVLIAEMPSRPIAKCMAGNMLLSSILVNKYVDHLPLHRQREIFKRADIQIAPSTIDSWVSQLGFLFEPLYEAMVKTVKNGAYLQADETPTRVLDKQKKGTTHKGYYWVYHDPLKRMVVFDYQKGRNKDAPREILKDFKGYLQTDGYASYNQFKTKKTVTHLACWAHARRYFEKALDQDRSRAEYAMERIQQLYAVEREIADFTPEEKKKVRLEKSLPIINELGRWISQENKKILPSSLIGKAFTYSINLWDSLQAYLYDGNLMIDNNLIENSIRPNALGRKNYLFAGSHEGAKRSAMFYSFFGTCKMHGVNPQKWMNKVLEVIADHKANKLHELFPQNLQLDE